MTDQAAAGCAAGERERVPRGPRVSVCGREPRLAGLEARHRAASRPMQRARSGTSSVRGEVEPLAKPGVSEKCEKSSGGAPCSSGVCSPVGGTCRQSESSVRRGVHNK